MNTQTSDEVVSASAIRKSYGSTTAVDGVDFTIPHGKCFGFLGPNGAGKTTTLRIILGLTPYSSGQLSVFGLPVPELARDIRARVGIVPQAENLDPDFTVAENLRVYASYFGIDRRTADERIGRLLEFAALGERRQVKTETLSGGMKRRLTIARALINNPDLVVLDEPTTGLDPQARHVIWSRLMELKEAGTTLILTTHYMEEAERLCDDLVIMDRGRILDQGSPTALIRRHVEPEVIEIRGKIDARDTQLMEQPGCRLENMGTCLYCYTHNSGELLASLGQRQGLTYLHRPSGLEDVFLRLTGRELRE